MSKSAKLSSTMTTWMNRVPDSGSLYTISSSPEFRTFKALERRGMVTIKPDGFGFAIARPVAASDKNPERSARVSETQSTKTLGEYIDFAKGWQSEIDRIERKYGITVNTIKLHPVDRFYAPLINVKIEIEDAVPTGKAWVGFNPENTTPYAPAPPEPTKAASAPEAAADKPVKAAKLSPVQVFYLRWLNGDTSYMTFTLVTIRSLEKRGLIVRSSEAKPPRRHVLTDEGRAALAAAMPDKARGSKAEPTRVFYTFNTPERELEFVKWTDEGLTIRNDYDGEIQHWRKSTIQTWAEIGVMRFEGYAPEWAKVAPKPASKGTVSPSLIAPTENIVKLTRLSAQSCAIDANPSFLRAAEFHGTGNTFHVDNFKPRTGLCSVERNGHTYSL